MIPADRYVLPDDPLAKRVAAAQRKWLKEELYRWRQADAMNRRIHLVREEKKNVA